MNAELRTLYLQRMDITEWVPRTYGVAPLVSEKWEQGAPTIKLSADKPVDSERVDSLRDVQAMASNMLHPDSIEKCAEVSLVSNTASALQNITPVSLPQHAATSLHDTALQQSDASLRVRIHRGEATALVMVLIHQANSGSFGNFSLLDAMMAAINLTTDNFCVASTLRRDQNDGILSEAKNVFVCGQIAAGQTLNRPVTLASVRGRVHEIGNQQIVISYHPDELRQNPELKKLAWQDLQLFARMIAKQKK